MLPSLHPQLQSGLKEVTELVSAHCYLFAKHFEDKTACIHQALDSSVIADETRELSSIVILDEFPSARLEAVDKVLGSVKAVTCALDPSPLGC